MLCTGGGWLSEIHPQPDENRESVTGLSVISKNCDSYRMHSVKLITISFLTFSWRPPCLHVSISRNCTLSVRSRLDELFWKKLQYTAAVPKVHSEHAYCQCALLERIGCRSGVFLPISGCDHSEFYVPWHHRLRFSRIDWHDRHL